MPDAPRPYPTPGGHHAATLEALALLGLGDAVDAGCVPGLAAALFDPDLALIDAHFPTAHDWRWRGDTLEVLHAPDGRPVRDVWYRRGDRLHLESRIELAR